MNRIIKFRVWDKNTKQMLYYPENRAFTFNDLYFAEEDKRYFFMRSTGLTDKNGKEIYEGDIVGQESVYQFLDRDGWKASDGNWKIIGEKTKNFTGKEEEKYIAGYKLQVVEWKDSSCGFEPFSDSDENCHHCGGAACPKDYEVIGNIYINSELLKANPASL